MTLRCDYCGQPAELLMDSSRLYRGVDYGPMYVCIPCDARVGVHPGTLTPLGRLANAELRQLKRGVHHVLDPLWRNWQQAYPEVRGSNKKIQNIQRSRVYAWLADAMGIPPAECHIGMFDEARCRQALDVIQRVRLTPWDIRDWAKRREGKAA